MHRNLHQFIKFFALIIFSVELLAPVILPAGPSDKTENAGTQLVNSSSASQTQLFCIFAEELDANEEDGLGHKEFTSLFDFNLISVFYRHHELIKSSQVFIQHSYQHIAAQPPLFLLNCHLLI